MVMLSTRLTGSSTSITVLSRRSALSTAASAPGIAKCSRTKSPAASLAVSHFGATVAA